MGRQPRSGSQPPAPKGAGKGKGGDDEQPVSAAPPSGRRDDGRRPRPPRSRSRQTRGKKSYKDERKDDGRDQRPSRGPQSAGASTGEPNLVTDPDIGGEMDGGAAGDFGLHLSQFAIHEMLSAALIASLDSGHRTDRCKLSALPTFCGDMCAITATAASYPQTKAASVVIGLVNPIQYDNEVKSSLNEQASSMLISNVGRPILRNIGSGSVFGLPCHTHAIPLMEECLDQTPNFGDPNSMLDVIDLVEGTRYLVGGDGADAAVLSAFKVVGCFYFWFLMARRRNTLWTTLRTELACMFMAGDHPGQRRLLDSLQRLYEDPMSQTAEQAFHKYIPYLSKQQMYAAMRDNAVFNFGVWAYPPFVNFIENIMRSDLDNHGVRWNNVKMPLQSDGAARGFTLGAVLTLEVAEGADYYVYPMPRRDPVEYFSVHKLEKKDVSIGVVYGMSLAFPPGANQLDFGPWLNNSLGPVMDRRPVQNTIMWRVLGARFNQSAAASRTLVTFFEKRGRDVVQKANPTKIGTQPSAMPSVVIAIDG